MPERLGQRPEVILITAYVEGQIIAVFCLPPRDKYSFEDRRQILEESRFCKKDLLNRQLQRQL